MTVIEIVVTGAIATALADLWQLALRHATGLPTAHWGMIGRWIAGVRHGVFIQHTIGDVKPVPGEDAIGWTFHYLVGVAYAGLFLAITATMPGTGTTLASALVFSVATLVAPWLVMQPALGHGIMAWRLPNRRASWFVTVTTHLAFGCGLYVGAYTTAVSSVA